MKIPKIASAVLFPPSLLEAAEIQQVLAQKVISVDAYAAIDSIAGVDVSNNLYDPKQMVYAAVVAMSYPALSVLETGAAAAQQELAYRPGFLGFREVPVVLKAMQQLKTAPDLLLVDGHGVSHPRQFGIASHLGVLLNIPAIGVAKTILVGKPAAELGPHPGDVVPLIWKGMTIGMLLRSKKRANPLIISIGHRISLESALKVVLNCLEKYRLPEPTRLAHQAANRLRVALS